MLKKLLFTLTLTAGLTLTSPAFAQENLDDMTKREKIQEIINLLQPNKDFVQQSLQSAMQMINRAPNATQEQKQQALNMAEQQIQDTLLVLNDAFIRVYDENFSEDEINVLMLFYQSEVGQKHIDLRPKMMKEAMTVMQEMAGQQGQPAQPQQAR